MTRIECFIFSNKIYDIKCPCHFFMIFDKNNTKEYKEKSIFE